MISFQQVHAHWLEHHRSIYRYIGTVTDVRGWTILKGPGETFWIWNEYCATSSERGRWLLSCEGVDGFIVPNGCSEENCFREIGAKFTSVTNVWAGKVELPDETPVDMRLVCDEETFEDFCFVFYKAYGCKLGLMNDIRAVCNKNVRTYVRYIDDLPVRTISRLEFEGLIAMGHGACVPEFQGQHLGDDMIKRIFGNDPLTIGFVQPIQAMQVAKRLGGTNVGISYNTWRLE